MFHGPKRLAVLASLRGVDVLLHSVTCRLPEKLAEFVSFRRVVVDECHIGMKAQKLAELYKAPCKWALSGTPFTTNLKPLERVATWLGVAQDRGLIHAMNTFERSANPDKTAKLARQLQKFVMRHTKSQLVAGGAALALPDCDLRDLAVDLDASERRRYELAEAHLARPTHLTSSLAVELVSLSLSLSPARPRRERERGWFLCAGLQSLLQSGATLSLSLSLSLSPLSRARVRDAALFSCEQEDALLSRSTFASGVERGARGERGLAGQVRAAFGGVGGPLGARPARAAAGCGLLAL